MQATYTRILSVAALVVVTVLSGCAGGTPEVDLSADYAGKAVTLSYAPSVGKTHSYLTETSTDQELSFVRGSWAFHVKGTRELEMTTAEVEGDGTVKMSVKYGEADLSMFRHGKEMDAAEVNKRARKLTGRTLTVWVTPDGQLKRWGGLKGLGWGENQVDLGEMTANEFVTSFLVLPREPVQLGYTWRRKFDMPVKSKKGKMDIVSDETYTFEKVVKLGAHKCARIRYEVLHTLSGEGETEAEGQAMNYRIDGDGESTGTIYFDLDLGIVVKKKTETRMEFETVTTKPPSEEEETFTVHQVSIETTTLKE